MIKSLNNLRGLAALLVLFFHYFALAWGEKVISIEQGQVMAYMGIGAFFLISGFIIPISLEKYKTAEFLKQRFFRIFPVLFATIALFSAAGTIINLFDGGLNSREYGKIALVVGASLIFKAKMKCEYQILLFLLAVTVIFAGSKGLLSSLLIYDLFGKYPKIAVLWTLTLEIRFYLLAASMFLVFKKINHKSFFFGLGVLWANFLIGDGFHVSLFLSYMMIGTGFYLFYKARQYLPFLLSIISFLLLNYFGSSEKLYYMVTALIFFLISFKFLEFENQILGFFANISYPLYLVHFPLFGYCEGFVKSKLLAVILATTISIIISLIIHKTMEERFIKFSKKSTLQNKSN